MKCGVTEFKIENLQEQIYPKTLNNESIALLGALASLHSEQLGLFNPVVGFSLLAIALKSSSSDKS